MCLQRQYYINANNHTYGAGYVFEFILENTPIGNSNMARVLRIEAPGALYHKLSTPFHVIEFSKPSDLLWLGICRINAVSFHDINADVCIAIFMGSLI